MIHAVTGAYVFDTDSVFSLQRYRRGTGPYPSCQGQDCSRQWKTVPLLVDICNVDAVCLLWGGSYLNKFQTKTCQSVSQIVCNLGESKLETVWCSNFRGMKIHRQWKFVGKLGKSCGVEVWKLAECFKVSEWIILRILTWRLFLNFLHVCARPSGLHGVTFDAQLAMQQLLSRSGGRLFCGISHFRQSLQPHAKPGHQVWPIPITNTQFIIYYPNILPSFDIYHISESHSGALYQTWWGQRNSWISCIV